MPAKAYQYALTLLSARGYTTRNLRRKLVQKEFESNEIESAMERLVSSGLLDDRRYAAEFARQRLVTGRSSARRVVKELALKGIAGNVARGVVAAVVDEEGVETIGLMESIARKKLALLGDLDSAVKRRRLFGFLARRGFEVDDIKHVIRHLCP
jgi:regulatory protein